MGTEKPMCRGGQSAAESPPYSLLLFTFLPRRSPSSPPHPPLSGCQPAHFTLFDLNVELNLSDPAEEQKLEHLISECEAVRLRSAEETKQIDEN